jgi:hypothetical protein
MPKFDERFARQYRYELPPEFPLASPYSGIVHHLSGPNGYARPQTFHEWKGWAMLRPGGLTSESGRSHPFTFIPHSGFDTQTLAYTLDSLVRVTRRVDRDHFTTEWYGVPPRVRLRAVCRGSRAETRSHTYLRRALVPQTEPPLPNNAAWSHAQRARAKSHFRSSPHYPRRTRTDRVDNNSPYRLL